VIPVSVSLSPIGVSAAWWLDAAARLEDAGAARVWCWDHFISRGRLSDPVLECWTTLAAAAARTTRIGVGSLVTNVMNRHPSVLAQTVASVQSLSGGRATLGIGIGGHPVEHAVLGIPFPDAAERSARLVEAVTLIRLLWSGGPASFDGAFYQLHDAHVAAIEPVVPPIVVAGMTPAGARLAARIGDGWTTEAATLERDLPAYLKGLEAAGRSRADLSISVTIDVPRDGAPDAPVLRDLAGEAGRWGARGADELVVSSVKPRHLDRVVAALKEATADRG